MDGIMNTALVKAWRISKKNSSMALGTALLLLVMGLLAAILFVIVFNYHEEYETLGELLRIPALVILQKIQLTMGGLRPLIH